jgi:hypothetical protein
MQELGYRLIKNTLIYPQLVKFESDELVCKVAKTVKEAQELVNQDSITCVMWKVTRCLGRESNSRLA